MFFNCDSEINFKKICILLVLCMQTVVVSPAGGIINSQEIEQSNDNGDDIWLHIKVLQEKGADCTECKNNDDQNVLLLATQIAMSIALVIGIFTIFVLFWKICSATYRWRPQRRRRRNLRNRESTHSQESLNSIQQIVAERLRDAPPNYIRAMLLPPGDTPPPYNLVASAHSNPCFDPDYNTPPPSYVAATEQESSSAENNRRNSDKSIDELRVELPKEIETSPDSTIHI